MGNQFNVHGVSLRLVREWANSTWQNERAVEVALGRYFCAKVGIANLTEVGAVMPFYGVEGQTVVDTLDAYPHCIRQNAIYHDFTGRNVLSISTIEHMMASECGNESDRDSITFIDKVRREALFYLVTWGIGYNRWLDEYMRSTPEIPRFILRRTNWKGEWELDPDSNNFSYLFGFRDGRQPEPEFNNANAVCVATNVPELLAPHV